MFYKEWYVELRRLGWKAQPALVMARLMIMSVEAACLVLKTRNLSLTIFKSRM